MTFITALIHFTAYGMNLASLETFHETVSCH